MTDTTKSTGSRPWTLMVTVASEFNEGTGSNGTPFLNFRGDIETSKGIKNRFISVFNTQRFPSLIEDVKAALASGQTKLTLRFEYGQGETAKILGVGHVDFRKAANDTGAETPSDEPNAELPLEAPAQEPVEAVDEAQQPEAADPMAGVVVEVKKPRRRRKAA